MKGATSSVCTQREVRETSLERKETLAAETLGSHRVPESSLSLSRKQKGRHGGESHPADYSNGAEEPLPRDGRLCAGLHVLLQQQRGWYLVWSQQSLCAYLCHHPPLIEKWKLRHSKEMFISTR